MPKLCTNEGCGKPHKAKGLCGTHYNQQLPNRHGKVTLSCEACGGPAVKEARARRYDTVYCSEDCRDYGRWGPRSSDLPRDHMSRWVGQSCEWRSKPAPAPFECNWCGADTLTSGNRDTYCREECRIRAKRSRRWGRRHGATGTYTWAQVVRLWVGFGKACAYCRQPLALEDTQAEHVIALARGGANNIGNILPACGACNSDKRDLSMAEWRADRARRGLALVVTEWAQTDPLYSHLSPAGMALAA